jgi:predicted phosphodiesterase
MKLLACSDIHDNLDAVRALRAAETNDFDAVVVAGDIGNRTADEFFEILGTFACPVFHVYGNWDDELEYGPRFGRLSTQLHMNVADAGPMAITGFSGCPAHWGKNPIAQQLRSELESECRAALSAYAEANDKIRRTQNDKREHDKALAARVRVIRSPEYQHYRDRARLLGGEILNRNRKALIDAIAASGTDPRRLVLVTHERLYRLHEDLPGVPLHLFGHQHGFSDKSSNGTKFVNVSILDHVVPLHPARKSEWSADECLKGQAGNYAVIEINAAREISVRCAFLPAGDEEWIPAEGARGAPSRAQR